MLPFATLHDIQRGSEKRCWEFFRQQPVRAMMTLGILFALPLPWFHNGPPMHILETQLPVAVGMLLLGIIQLLLYAICSMTTFRIIDAGKVELERQLIESLSWGRSFFGACALASIAIGLVLEAIHAAARLHLGLSAFGRVFEGHRYVIALGDQLVFLLATDFLCLGGWLAAFFFASGDPTGVLRKTFKIELSTAVRFLLLWFYSWKVILLIPVAWAALKLVWWFGFGMLARYMEISGEAFKSGTLGLLYNQGFLVACYMVSVPLYARVQFFRLGVAKAAQNPSLLSRP